MTEKEKFAVSCLYESIGREDFAIHLYGRQNHRDPFAENPFAPLYYVLDEVYFLQPSPVFLNDLIGIVEIEILHKRRFTAAAREINPGNEPVPKIIFPEGLFASVAVPEVEPIPGMKTALRVLLTDIVQEQRAQLIYEYFSRENSGAIRSLFQEIADQEKAHRRIFEGLLREAKNRKPILMFCPVCGKMLPFEPNEGFESGCGYCRSKLVLKIEGDDFILKLR
jgi:rubrerythrin